METAKQHGINYAQSQCHDLVPKNGGPVADRCILSHAHIDKGTSCNQDNRDQNGHESGKGPRQIFSFDQNIVYIGGGGFFDLGDDFRNGLDKFLVGPIPQYQPSQHQSSKRNGNAPADRQAQVRAQHDRNGQDTRSGRDNGMC